MEVTQLPDVGRDRGGGAVFIRTLSLVSQRSPHENGKMGTGLGPPSWELQGQSFRATNNVHLPTLPPPSLSLSIHLGTSSSSRPLWPFHGASEDSPKENSPFPP